MEYLDLLNKELREEERIFKFKSAVCTGRSVKIELICDAQVCKDFLTPKLKQSVSDISQKIMPEGITANVSFIKTTADEVSVMRELLTFINQSHSLFYDVFAAAPAEIISDINGIRIILTVEKFVASYATDKDLAKQIAEHLGRHFVEEFSVTFNAVPNSEGELPEVAYINSAKVLRTHSIEIIKTVFKGRHVSQRPRYIVDIKNVDALDVAICGAISNVRKKFNEKTNKYIYSFNINDTTGAITAKVFAKEDERNDYSSVFADGNTLALQGNCTFDKYLNAQSFLVNAAALCTVDKTAIDLTETFKGVPTAYSIIFPQKYIDIEQENFYGNLLGEEPESDVDKLKGKTYVVFDLETTGLSNEDKIIEIGAVKIVNGVLKETFETLINPHMPIPAGATMTNNITDDMVKNAPIIDAVFPDFYRFIDGCTLVAHNANFDLGFINREAKGLRYIIDNPHLDTMILARQKLPVTKVNLAAVIKYLNITNAAAHRALSDTIATAKAFIKLVSMEKKV